MEIRLTCPLHKDDTQEQGKQGTQGACGYLVTVPEAGYGAVDNSASRLHATNSSTDASSKNRRCWRDLQVT
jgi:hypothetical protein